LTVSDDIGTIMLYVGITIEVHTCTHMHGIGLM